MSLSPEQRRVAAKRAATNALKDASGVLATDQIMSNIFNHKITSVETQVQAIAQTLKAQGVLATLECSDNTRHVLFVSLDWQISADALNDLYVSQVGFIGLQTILNDQGLRLVFKKFGM